MKTFRAFVIVAATFLLPWSLAGSANASLIQEIFINDDSDPSGVIVFPTETGDQMSGAGIDFSLFAFDQDDILDIEWEIDEDWVLSMSLEARIGPACGPTTGPDPCANSTLDLKTNGFGQVNNFGCATPPGGEDKQCMGAVSQFTPLFVPVHEAPEPATYLLFLAGLFGLGFVVRRRSLPQHMGAR